MTGIPVCPTDRMIPSAKSNSSSLPDVYWRPRSWCTTSWPMPSAARGGRRIRGLEHRCRCGHISSSTATSRDLVRAVWMTFTQYAKPEPSDIGDIAEPALGPAWADELAVHRSTRPPRLPCCPAGRSRRRPGISRPCQARGPRQAAHPPLGGACPSSSKSHKIRSMPAPVLCLPDAST